MIKLSIEPHPYKKSVFNLCLDQNPFKEIHTTLFGKKPSLPRSFPTEEEAEKWYEEIIFKRAKHYALRRLSEKSYHSVKMRQALIDRCTPADVADNVIHYCTEQGFLQDYEWVIRFVRQRIRKGEGPKLIKYHLKGKRIHEERIDQIIAEEETDEERQERAAELFTRYQQKYPKQKAIAATLRKGFEIDDFLS